MCPACLSTTALLLAGAGSGGVSALLAHRRWRARKEEPMTTPVKTLPTRIEEAIAETYGIRPAVVLRTPAELETVV